MTTEKQVKANQENSKKSTGAKTPEGKAAVSTNALKHGLFSSRLILPNESIDEYHQLLDGLIASLHPYGSFELMLVEKIAVAAWRQLRLTRAESASIELNTRTEQNEVRKAVELAMRINWQHPLKDTDFEPMVADETEHFEWCGKVMREYLALENSVLEGYKLDLLEKYAPEIYGQLQADWGEHIDNLAYRMQADKTSLHDWADELNTYCIDVVARDVRRPAVQAITKTVQDYLTAPMSNELMVRYQMALDSELYKAAEALRKQQEHRAKVGIVSEVEQ